LIYKNLPANTSAVAGSDSFSERTAAVRAVNGLKQHVPVMACPLQLHGQVLGEDGWVFPQAREAVTKHVACTTAARSVSSQGNGHGVRYLPSGRASHPGPRRGFHTPWVLRLFFFPPSSASGGHRTRFSEAGGLDLGKD